MTPALVGLLLVLAAVVAIVGVFFLWLRVLHDIGPALVATTVSVGAFIAVAVVFAILQGGGLGDPAPPASEWG